MKLRSEVSSEKLRGGYYTPPELTAFCWRRAMSLARGFGLKVLEPAAGDGAFFATMDEATRQRIEQVDAIELDPSEASKCAEVLRVARVASRVHVGSFLTWSLDQRHEYDVAIGNPPFVRFQFVSEDDAAAASVLGIRLGTRIEGVSNLWMPILLAALDRLRLGGVGVFVVPAELFTGMSAAVVRRWILENMDELTIDLFPPGRFPGVLQEVVVLSARRAPKSSGRAGLSIVQHRETDSESAWRTNLGTRDVSWMRVFLTATQNDALDNALSHPAVRPLSTVARMQVSIVTGANGYFCVTDETLDRFGLQRWAIPLLPRARYVHGLIWSKQDQRLLGPDTRRWLVHFAADRPAPERYAGASRFLQMGVEAGLPQRYKCRVRSPWYRVPDVWAGTLLLSKRSHLMPKLILNSARTFTTDTIYRGAAVSAAVRERDLVATFHNSLTLLTAELEGRSFGGGVHELVPSEIERLLLPVFTGAGERLSELDAVARALAGDHEEQLIARTNALLVEFGFDRRTLDALEEARRGLMTKRLDRTQASRLPRGAEELVAV